MTLMPGKFFHKIRALAALVLLALGIAGCASVPNQSGQYGPPAYFGGYASYGYGWGGGYVPSGYYPWGYGWEPDSGYPSAPIIISGGQSTTGNPVHPAPPPAMPPPFHGHGGFEKPLRPYRTKNGTTIYPP